MLKFFFGAVLLLCALMSNGAQANFVATDWKQSGDAKATLDVETGLEWLGLTETRTLSRVMVGRHLAR